MVNGKINSGKENKSATPNILEVKNIQKSFYKKEVVHDLSFRVKGGETFGLLGPNGAGKTTIMRMIMNIIKPDFGEILYNGEQREKIKSVHFGYLPEERGLYPGATVLDTLIYFGTLSKIAPRKAEVEAIRYLDRLGMINFTDTPINHLSKGMQQKVQLIAAFLHDPDVLILDEPFSGLDPINQIVLRDILKEYKEKKKILIISTHQMEMAEKLCDHSCMINHGHVVVDGSLKEIKRQNSDNAFLIETETAMPFLREFPGVEILEENNTAYKFRFNNKNPDLGSLFEIVSKKTRIRKFETIEPSLHDIFIRLIGIQER